MKYIKTYEGKIKDKILLGLSNYFRERSDKYTKYKRNMYVLTTDGKIGKIGAVDNGYIVNYWMVNDFPDDGRDENDPYAEEDIVREATPEEIEQYKLEQDTEKYNL